MHCRMWSQIPKSSPWRCYHIYFNFCFYIQNLREDEFMWGRPAFDSQIQEGEMVWDTASPGVKLVGPHHSMECPVCLFRFPTTKHTPPTPTSFIQPSLSSSSSQASSCPTRSAQVIIVPWNVLHASLLVFFSGSPSPGLHPWPPGLAQMPADMLTQLLLRLGQGDSCPLVSLWFESCQC